MQVLHNPVVDGQYVAVLPSAHDLLKPAAAAAVLLTTVATLAQWRYLGRGPAYVKLGRSVLYRGEDLIAHIEVSRVETTVAGVR